MVPALSDLLKLLCELFGVTSVCRRRAAVNMSGHENRGCHMAAFLHPSSCQHLFY